MDYRTNRKMVDSGVEWIGEIPDKWDVSKMKSFGGFRTGRNPDTKNEGAIPIYGSSDKSFDFTSRAMSSGPAVCIGRKGTIDKPFFVKEPFWAVDTCMYSEVPGNSHSIDFVKHWLHIIPWSEVGTKTALPSLTQSDANNLHILTPPLPLQQAIANYLDHHVGLIDEERKLISKKIELLKEQRSVLIFEVVTGKRTLVEAQHLAGLDDWSDIIGSGLVVAVPTPRADDSFVKSGRLMDSGVEWIGEIPDGWKVDRIKNLTSKIQSGRTPVDMERVTSADGIPWITISDMSSGQIREDKATRIIPGSAGPEAKSGDVLYSIYATIGVAAGPITSRVATNQAILSLRPVGNGKYMKYSLDAVRPFMLQAALSNTQANLSTGAVRQIFLPSPSPDLQQEIAEFLDYETGLIDKEIELLTAKNELLSAKRKALIFEAVTGKIEING